ncbi:MAG: hypothetical protein ACRDNF_27195 [Streptosporangiaceae bacterium]
MTVTLPTVVLDVPPSPLGLSPRHFVVEHRCRLCGQIVRTEALVAHARDHWQAQ